MSAKAARFLRFSLSPNAQTAPMQLMPQQSPQVICATGESTDTYLMILGTVKTIAGPKFARSSNRVENMRSLTPVSQMS